MPVRLLYACLSSPSWGLLAIALATVPARAANLSPPNSLALNELQKRATKPASLASLELVLTATALGKPSKWQRGSPPLASWPEIPEGDRPLPVTEPTPLPRPELAPPSPATATERADQLSNTLDRLQATTPTPTADDLAATPLLAEDLPGVADAKMLVTRRSPQQPDRWFADWQGPAPTVQTQPPAPTQSQIPAPPLPDDRPSAPEFPAPQLPTEPSDPLPDLEPTPPQNLEPTPSTPPIPDAIQVERFEFVGTTIFSDADFAEIIRDYISPDAEGQERVLSFADLLAIRSRITEYYTERGYITTGALIPPQEFVDGVITIQIVEGRLEEIVVNGTRRLNPDYIRSRLAIATTPPLNINRLRDALQLLQLDPLIDTLVSELAAGTELGTNRLIVRVVEADSFQASGLLNNNRSPSVGSLRRGVTATEANLLGLGDSLSLSYGNTDGSNNFDIGYTLPFSPRNGTLRFAFGTTASQVIEEPFDILDIRSDSRYYEIGIRQPLSQTPATEFAIGLNFSRQESETTLLGIPFPFPFTGADDEGQVRISALRFYQEWTNRSERQVLAARSQFSLGVDWLGATENRTPPDSHFFSWRGQGQWVQLLAPDTLLVVRGDVQWSDRALPSLERFGLGGQDTIRGYRQDTLLTDNGVLASAELRWPVLRWSEAKALLQIAPFVDFGLGWNNDPDNAVETNAITAIGLGLRWQMGNYLTVRFDWGIPLTDLNTDSSTWQENGLYFSINLTPF
ncbi:MAG: BamA/TamA family outer membrane protein [Spirulinaceae cyanobacterium RM2_2_10]|nr:BamA/TamA family outer membrane protein [Spirulinaceae cyanobacterium SM2_1_0]NJO20355.1 BamA/TamA family outer membrane protein [Spirulinaceae cyanobacterium RM2_2_10]